MSSWSSCPRRFQRDDRRRISRLTRLDPAELLTTLHPVTLEGLEADDAPGDAAAEHGVLARDLLDAADGEERLLEVGLLHEHGLDAEVLNGLFVENDGLGRPRLG